MSSLSDALNVVASRISEILEESSTELSSFDNQKLEEILEDIIDMVSDLDKVLDVDEVPPKCDVAELLYELQQEDNSWEDFS